MFEQFKIVKAPPPIQFQTPRKPERRNRRHRRFCRRRRYEDGQLILVVKLSLGMASIFTPSFTSLVEIWARESKQLPLLAAAADSVQSWQPPPPPKLSNPGCRRRRLRPILDAADFVQSWLLPSPPLSNPGCRRLCPILAAAAAASVQFRLPPPTQSNPGCRRR